MWCDTRRNRCWLGRIRYRMGFAGYPTLRLMALAKTGTRGLLGAALGSAADRDEATVARRLLPLLRRGILILLDRAFDANAFLREVAATGALLVARSKSTRHPPVLGHLPDGSYLSDLGGLAVRRHPARRWVGPTCCKTPLDRPELPQPALTAKARHVTTPSPWPSSREQYSP